MITNKRFMGRLAQAGALSLLLGLFCVPFTGTAAEDRAGEGGKVRKEGEKRAELGERERPKGDVEALELRLKELKHKIQALAAEGKGAAAEEVEREARGVAEKLEWKQAADALEITKPASLPTTGKEAIGLKITFMP